MQAPRFGKQESGLWREIRPSGRFFRGSGRIFPLFAAGWMFIAAAGIFFQSKVVRLVPSHLGARMIDRNCWLHVTDLERSR